MADAESQLVQELRELAGVKQGDSFEIAHDGVRVRVSYSGGSSSSLTLAVTYDTVAREAQSGTAYRGGAPPSAIRPLMIELFPETDGHRQAKASGTDIEFQSGDRFFDHGVYVDTQTPADVLAHVLEAEVRRAVLELFALDFTTINIDDHDRNVVARMVSFASAKHGEPTGARAVDAFARLARSLPRLATRAGEHAKHPLRGVNKALALFAVTVLTASFPIYCSGIMGNKCPNEMSPTELPACVGPGLIGLIPGILVGALASAAAVAFTRRYRGRSDSSRHGAMFSGLVFFLALVTTTLLASSIVAR